MGNVLKALQKSATATESPPEPAIHVISMAVASAARVAKESLDRDAGVKVEPKGEAGAGPAVAEATTTPSAVEAGKPVEMLLELRPGAGMEYSPLLVLHHKPRCSASEQVRQLRSSLLKLADKSGVRCLITSARPQEGKSVTAGNLAYSFSELTHKRTLLIDLDLRCGRVAELFGVGSRTGLADLLSRQCTADEAICRTSRENLDIVTAGNADVNIINEMISSDWADSAVRNMIRGYDHVIFDAPPALGIADVGIIGHWANQALLAVRMNKTPRELVEQAAATLQSAGVSLSGLIALDEEAIGKKYYRYSDQ